MVRGVSAYPDVSRRRPTVLSGAYVGSLGHAVTTMQGLAQAEVETQVAEETPEIVTLWALQNSDDSFSPTQTKKKYLINAVDAGRLQAAERAAFGEPIPFVAVISDKPMRQSEVTAAWQGTPYESAGTEVVYRERDNQPVPVGYFLHWGSLRGDSVTADYTKLEVPRVKLGGTLVYPASAPIVGNERPAPGVPFSAALEIRNGQMGPTPAPLPEPVQLPDQDDTAPLPPAPAPEPGPAPAPVRTASQTTQAITVALLTAGCVVLGYNLVSRNREWRWARS